MIYKLYILIDNRLILSKFNIIKDNNKIIINSTNKYDTIVVPIYNKYECITYYKINLPLELLIVNYNNENMIFNPLIILSSYNLKYNELDFFYLIEEFIYKNYNLSFIHFENFLNNNFINLIKIYNYYINNIDIIDIDKKAKKKYIYNILYTHIPFTLLDIIKTCIIYSFIKNNNKILPKYINNIMKHINNFKYSIIDDIEMNFINHYNYNNQKLNINNLIIGNYYYIKNNDKIMKIKIDNINNNIIIFDNNNIIFNNYEWYLICPNININNQYVIYKTFINDNITLAISNIINNNLSNIILNKFNTNIISNINDINILSSINYIKKKNFNITFGENIDTIYSNNTNINLNEIKKYIKLNICNNNEIYFFLNRLKLIKSDNNYLNQLINILYQNYLINNKKSNIFNLNNNDIEYISNNNLNIDQLYNTIKLLNNNYNYPLKTNKHDIDDIFDYILYISLIYRDMIFSNDTLDTNISIIINHKLKNLYINLLKILIQLIKNNYTYIAYNTKIYNDYLHRNIIKIIFTNSDKLFIKYLKSIIPSENFDKIKYIISSNLMLLDTSTKLNWFNLSHKLNYLNLFYKNNNILLYQNKINKNIMVENCDNKIKNIIENPFEMYKYLNKEIDFIKWTKFINNKIINIYYIPISICYDDFKKIGKLLYLLFNINEQNINNETYINFINYCNKYSYLILDNNRINIKIKEFFNKCNINLGILAKHLTWNKNIITFNNNTNNYDELNLLKTKIIEITLKYHKYKKKYFEYKNIELAQIN